MIQEKGTGYSKTDIERLKVVARMCSGSVLDIGCGDGRIKQYLPEGCRYLGIDTEPYGEAIYGDIYKFDVPCWFDTVLMLEVLEHLERPLDALRRVRKLTNGKVIISVPNPYNADQIASVIHNDTNIENINHIAMFGDNEIKSICFHAGFYHVSPIRFFTKIPGLNCCSPLKSRFGEWNIYEVRP